MKISVRQLKGLIREAISEAHDDMTGYAIDPGDDRGQLHNKGRSSKKMFALFVGSNRSVLAGVFSSKIAAEVALEKHFDGGGMIRPVAVEPNAAELRKLYDSLAGGGGL